MIVSCHSTRDKVTDANIDVSAWCQYLRETCWIYSPFCHSCNSSINLHHESTPQLKSAPRVMNYQKENYFVLIQVKMMLSTFRREVCTWIYHLLWSIRSYLRCSRSDKFGNDI